MFGASGRGRGLDRVRGHGDLVHAGPLCRGVDVDLCGGLGLGLELPVVVVLDVVPGDLEVAHLGSLDANPAEPVVADVVPAEVDLVEVDLVEEDADPGVVVDVGVVDEDVAVASVQANAMADLSDEQALEDRLHGADELHAIGLRVGAGDLEVSDRGHALMLPDVWLDGTRCARARVGADDAKGWPLPGHHDRGSAASPVDPEATGLVERDLDGLGDEVVSSRKGDAPVPIGEGMPDRLGIVGHPVPVGSEFSHATHRETLAQRDIGITRRTALTKCHPPALYPSDLPAPRDEVCEKRGLGLDAGYSCSLGRGVLLRRGESARGTPLIPGRWISPPQLLPALAGGGD